MPQSSLKVLTRFMRLASEKASRDDILAQLAEAAVEHAGDAAAIVGDPDGAGGPRIVVARELPDDLRQRAFDWDVIDTSLGAGIAAASNGVFELGHTYILVSGGGLFGALVLLFRKAASVDAGAIELASALADATAIRLHKDAQLAELVRSYAELRASQESLARSNRLRAVGQMASGIAHDLKNILNPLSLHLQIAKRAVARADTKQADESVAEMQRVVRRGVETVERLRDFSRQAPERAPEIADLDALVHEAIEIARPRMAVKNSALNKIREELGAPPKVRVHASDVVGAIVNLVVNAIDAMPGGGAITLRTGESAGEVWLEVSDEGPGMPPEVEQRVFEPFFTTKGHDGTGLGLAMVYACVQRHGGRIALKTAPGQGATFTIWLPATRDE